MTTKKCYLKKNRDIPFKNHHPWIFSGAINKCDTNAKVGDEIAVYDSENNFIGYGLYNPKSQIRIRLYSFDLSQPLDDNFWKRKIISAINMRIRTLPHIAFKQACRIVYSEGDGLSGLIVDRYEDYLVVQFTSYALWLKKDIIIKVLQNNCFPKGIFLRTEKHILEEEGLELTDCLIEGQEPESDIIIEENGLFYYVDIQTGQKTGFYHDQRDNRLEIRNYAKEKRCLDICTYSGGFAMNMARGLAWDITAVDISPSALNIARRNAILNGLSSIKFVQADAFSYLTEQVKKSNLYDMIVLDPPKFTHSKSSVKQALKEYIQLNTLAMQLLDRSGILVTCSCSGRILLNDFIQAVHYAGLQAKKQVRILQYRGAAIDHPIMIQCQESSYLKCLICEIEPL
ncbi:MAG: class I SAM-dependent rRNA methyltransferase [Candidatus Cloacimonetes bacterium]|nr:class I SAM-dependent rRNA methyltransferase [Candidatus Cloacimonadota bacterium]MDD4155146.1 class I SAM-dependent rRNA methyltransferase [Candidatus Cloacimonadota bacterium]